MASFHKATISPKKANGFVRAHSDGIQSWAGGGHVGTRAHLGCDCARRTSSLRSRRGRISNQSGPALSVRLISGDRTGSVSLMALTDQPYARTCTRPDGHRHLAIRRRGHRSVVCSLSASRRQWVDIDIHRLRRRWTVPGEVPPTASQRPDFAITITNLPIEATPAQNAVELTLQVPFVRNETHRLGIATYGL